MKYKLIVIKYEDNKNYEAEMAKWKEDTRFPNYGRMETVEDMPRKEVAERSLEVFLTEEEYKKVKEGVIKVFE